MPDQVVTETAPCADVLVDLDLPPVALHVCCGPCATAVIERLSPEWSVCAVWHNPNIQPSEEHARRLESMETVAESTDVSLSILEYDPDRWLEECRALLDEPEGGRRCAVCFRMRLMRTAQWAVEHDVETIATTLSISPHKDVELINAIGAEVARECGLRFLIEDFKQRNGFQRSVQLSREMCLYRQDYCGCLPSRR